MSTETKDDLESAAWAFLCQRLGRDPCETWDSDTSTIRAATKAMAAFAQMAPSERAAIQPQIGPSKKALMAKIRTLKEEMGAQPKKDWFPVHRSYLHAVLDAASIHVSILPDIEQ